MKRLTFWAAWIGILWLMFAVGIRGADADALWYDEIRSVAVVGGAHFGPYNPVEIVDKGIINGSVEQLPAFYFTLWIWGYLVGWSELAMRALPLFFGLLALAWTYRLGRDLHSTQAGLIAAFMLGLSSFFLYYVHELRTFTLIAMATAFALWCYHHLMRRAKPSPWWHVGLFLGIFTLLHTHYFAIPLVAALGLYHLIFQRRNRWRPVIPTLAAGAIAALWLPIFFAGFNNVQGEVELHGRAISFFESFTEVLYYFSNGFPLLLVALLIFITVLGWRSKVLRFIAWVAIVSLAFIAALNEVAQVLTTSRIRYLIVMWPLLALWLGVGLSQLTRIRYGVLINAALLAIWFAGALYANVQPSFLAALNLDPYPRWRTITNAIKANSQPTDAFVFHAGTLADQTSYPLAYASAGLGMPSFISLALYDDSSPDNQAWAQQQIDTAQRIWYGVDEGVESESWRADFEAFLHTDFVNCGVFAKDNRLLLGLYARSEAHCPGRDAIATFGDGIILAGLETTQTANALQIALGFDVAPEVPLHTYSVAVQMLDNEGQPIAQSDAGLPPGNFAIVSLVVPLESVEAGDYPLHLIVYNWQTGERLPAIHITESTANDSLLLDTIIVD